MANIAIITATAAVAASGALSNGGSLVALSGAMPATPETALSGNTTLDTTTYSATAYGSPSFAGGFVSATASFTGNSNPVANGPCTFMRAYKSDGTSVVADYTVGSLHIANNVAAVGQFCTNTGNTYVVASVTGDAKTGAASPPTGTGSGIVDGNVTWNYVGAGQLFDALLGNCNIQVGVPVTCTQTLKMPAA